MQGICLEVIEMSYYDRKEIASDCTLLMERIVKHLGKSYSALLFAEHAYSQWNIS